MEGLHKMTEQLQVEQNTDELLHLYQHFRITARQEGVHYTNLAWREYVDQFYEMTRPRLKSNPEDKDKRSWRGWKAQFPEIIPASGLAVDTYLESFALQCSKDLVEGDPPVVRWPAQVNIIKAVIYARTTVQRESVDNAVEQITSYLDQKMELFLKQLHQEVIQSSQRFNELTSLARTQFYDSLRGIDRITVEKYENYDPNNKKTLFEDY